eukprot:6159512-Prymnesium_polylepis.1
MLGHRHRKVGLDIGGSLAAPGRRRAHGALGRRERRLRWAQALVSSRAVARKVVGSRERITAQRQETLHFGDPASSLGRVSQH